jgi:hypothetical protein
MALHVRQIIIVNLIGPVSSNVNAARIVVMKSTRIVESLFCFLLALPMILHASPSDRADAIDRGRLKSLG